MWDSRCQSVNCSGMALLSGVLLLLILASLVTLYVSKVKSLEYQILNNVQSRHLALNAANRGLNHALATLQAKPDWSTSGTGSALASGGHYVVQTTDNTLPVGTRLKRAISISATGTTQDGLTHANVAVDAVIYPIVARIPPAPVMIGGGPATLNGAVTGGGHLVVGVNPDGLGVGNPLALWSSPALSPATRIETCLVSNLGTMGCGGNTLSHLGAFGSDVLDSNSTFPTDLWLYAFNLNAGEAAALEQEANTRATDCSLITSQTSGFVWVQGDCVISAGVTLGSAADPVLLVVVNGNLSLQASAVIHGLVFWASTAAKNGPFHITANNGAVIYGALLATQVLDMASTGLRVIYDKNTLTNLHAYPFLRVAVVPGSWRDF